MSRSLGSKGRRSRLTSAYKLPEHQGSWCVESVGEPPLDRRGEGRLGPLRSVSGKVRCSDEYDFYIERLKDGRRLRLDMTRPMARQADDLLHQHVTAHGWFEAPDLFAVHSLASSEDDAS